MKLFRDLIEASGYETVRTRNGLEALELARTHRPDLILMDIQLPEVSGLEVTKWLKADDELHVIPVIAVTAFAMTGDEARIRKGGCEAYIAKPIAVPRLIETIKSYLGDACPRASSSLTTFRPMCAFLRCVCWPSTLTSSPPAPELRLSIYA